MKFVVGLLLLSGVTLCVADVYMHNPRGSNDRNCERNVNRNNGNRLFDSQNNAKGGYACPRAVGGPAVQTNKMYYYEGSVLPIEWTNQHGCGDNSKLHCDIILQYACEDTLDPLGKFRSGANIGSPRDGIPRDANDAATDRIPENAASAVANTVETRRFGMHESIDFYNDCKARERNKGLFTADQRVRRNDARATRQNPNGARRGLECPEERDYYPYWAPTPWVDIAVITSKVSAGKIAYYRANSQNTAPKGKCVAGTTAAATQDVTNRANKGLWYNNAGACTNAVDPTTLTRCAGEGGTCACAVGNTILYGAQGSYNQKVATAATTSCRNSVFGDPIRGQRKSCYCGTQAQVAALPKLHNWVSAAGFQVSATQTKTFPAPAVVQGQMSRVNQLGNSGGPVVGGSSNSGAPQGLNANRYVWNIPNHINDNCVLRLRYNISTMDYNAYSPNKASAAFTGVSAINSSFNGQNSPVKQDPYVTIGSGPTDFLSLAVNTNQYGRTFQDRSYVFAIKPRTAALAGKNIYNLNVRGKRGNIVQTYPAVEYDFVPNDLQILKDDFVHFQWTGSDYNPRRGCNNGEGGPPDPNTVAGANNNARADRSNIIETTLAGDNYPRDVTAMTAAQTMFTTATGAKNTALVKKLAFLDQTGCLTQAQLQAATNNKNTRERLPRNCAKLNAAKTPYFDAGPQQMRNPGQFTYFSSRNNNFSNRDQTGHLCVKATSTSTCTGVPAAGAVNFGTQLPSDVPLPVTSADLLTAPTTDPNNNDNDAVGSGGVTGCGNVGGVTFGQLSKQEQSQIVAAAVGSIFGGCLIGIGVMFGYRKFSRGGNVKVPTANPDNNWAKA
jgi:hypothetical protein